MTMVGSPVRANERPMDFELAIAGLGNGLGRWVLQIFHKVGGLLH